MNAECIHDIGAMHGNGVCTQAEVAGDFFVGFAIYDELKDFQFTRR